LKAEAHGATHHRKTTGDDEAGGRLQPQPQPQLPRGPEAGRQKFVGRSAVTLNRLFLPLRRQRRPYRHGRNHWHGPPRSSVLAPLTRTAECPSLLCPSSTHYSTLPTHLITIWHLASPSSPTDSAVRGPHLHLDYLPTLLTFDLPVATVHNISHTLRIPHKQRSCRHRSPHPSTTSEVTPSGTPRNPCRAFLPSSPTPTHLLPAPEAFENYI
jgi:hypothetical protein